MDTEIPSGSVVVGMDGSESARRALSWAADLADRERRSLSLVHSIEAPAVPYQGYGWVTADITRWRRELTGWAQKELREATSSLAQEHPDLDVQRVVSDADPRSTLGEASARAFVVVVGTHGHGRVARMVLGSVSEYVARHAECPVVVVRPTLGDGPVIAAVDDTPAAAPVLEFAFHQASVWHRALRVVHADARSAVALATEADVRDAHLRLAESVAAFRDKYPDVVAETEVLASDDPESALVEASRSACLLVVGRRSRGMIRDLVTPPVVTAVLERALCPVGVVPAATATP